MSNERRVDRLPVAEPELVLLGSGVSLGPVRSPRVQAMLECMAVGGGERPTEVDERDQVTRSTDV